MYITSTRRVMKKVIFAVYILHANGMSRKIKLQTLYMKIAIIAH